MAVFVMCSQARSREIAFAKNAHFAYDLGAEGQ